MKGYYNMEEQTRQQFLEDGWFRTGDSGWLDEMGSLHFQSRLSEMIVRGGENISPSEIENQIMLCDRLFPQSRLWAFRLRSSRKRWLLW